MFIELNRLVMLSWQLLLILIRITTRHAEFKQCKYNVLTKTVQHSKSVLHVLVVQPPFHRCSTLLLGFFRIEGVLRLQQAKNLDLMACFYFSKVEALNSDIFK